MFRKSTCFLITMLLLGLGVSIFVSQNQQQSTLVLFVKNDGYRLQKGNVLIASFNAVREFHPASDPSLQSVLKSSSIEIRFTRVLNSRKGFQVPEEITCDEVARHLKMLFKQSGAESIEVTFQ